MELDHTILIPNCPPSVAPISSNTMKKTSPQNINAIVVSGSDTDDGRPGYPESNKDGTDTITIFNSDDEREMTHPRFENNVAIASATRGQNAQEIVALKMASAYVVFSGRTVGVFTDWFVDF